MTENKTIKNKINELLRLHEIQGYCEKHGSFICTVQQGNEAFCPQCLADEEAKCKAEQEKQKKIIDTLSSIDGLSERYKQAGFKNFVKTKENEWAFQKVLSFAKQPGKKWLIMLGNNGTGKTHLAHAVLKVTGGIFRDFADITDEFLDMQNGIGEGRINLINKYAFAPMLVIDEIDKVKDTEGRIAWLNRILSKRYDNYLPLIICGNIDLKDLYQRIDLHSGFAMKDRMSELGEVLYFNWKSYRSNLREGEKNE